MVIVYPLFFVCSVDHPWSFIPLGLCALAYVIGAFKTKVVVHEYEKKQEERNDILRRADMLPPTEELSE